ncbi:hypothetical protein [Streptomyces sp. NPDC007070]|uniref:hypothetical protein n=1 Tax=Streptomyces sp. NPDC007070 TaxID=3154312 RepID=UPI0033E83887
MVVPAGVLVSVRVSAAAARAAWGPYTPAAAAARSGAVRIISPYDLDARRAIRGNTRWNGYLVHVTETCDAAVRVNLIPDIATISLIRDTQALPGIHTRLRDRRLLPAQHLVDGGYISTAPLNNSARDDRSSSSGRSRRAEHGRRRSRPASPATTSRSTSTSARSPAPTGGPAPPGSRPRP